MPFTHCGSSGGAAASSCRVRPLAGKVFALCVRRFLSHHGGCVTLICEAAGPRGESSALREGEGREADLLAVCRLRSLSLAPLLAATHWQQAIFRGRTSLWHPPPASFSCTATLFGFHLKSAQSNTNRVKCGQSLRALCLLTAFGSLQLIDVLLW